MGQLKHTTECAPQCPRDPQQILNGWDEGGIPSAFINTIKLVCTGGWEAPVSRADLKQEMTRPFTTLASQMELLEGELNRFVSSPAGPRFIKLLEDLQVKLAELFKDSQLPLQPDPRIYDQSRVFRDLPKLLRLWILLLDPKRSKVQLDIAGAILQALPLADKKRALNRAFAWIGSAVMGLGRNENQASDEIARVFYPEAFRKDDETAAKSVEKVRDHLRRFRTQRRDEMLAIRQYLNTPNFYGPHTYPPPEKLLKLITYGCILSPKSAPSR